MKKSTKILLRILGAIIVISLLFFFVAGPIIKKATKKHSPEVTEAYSANGLELEVFYCSPSKKGRVIFGNVVPLNEVWRTGANEATTFSTNKNIVVSGKELPAGKYTLWTIPDYGKWEIIFNSKMYGWGVDFKDGKASREPKYDVANFSIPVSKSFSVQENFSIKLQESGGIVMMVVAWDDISIPIPIKAIEQ